MLLNASITDIDHRNKEGSYFPRIHTGSCEFPYDDTPGIQPKFAVSTLRPMQSLEGLGHLALLLERLTLYVSISIARGASTNPPSWSAGARGHTRVVCILFGSQPALV
mgnify:FL=1